MLTTTSAAGERGAAATYAPVLQHTPSAAANDSALELSLASPTACSSAQTEDDDGANDNDDDDRASCDSTVIASDSEQLANAAVLTRPERMGSQSSSGVWGMQLCISALSAISGFLFGYDLCVMVVALPLIQAVRCLSFARSFMTTDCAY